MKLFQSHITYSIIKALRVLLVFLSFSFSSLFTNAQNYPVQVNINATGPFYNYLPYYADINNHLQVVATFTDFNATPVNVKLRVRIEGPGYELRTNPNFQGGNTFFLTPGMPEYIQGIDLAPLLTNNSLIKQPGNFDLNDLPEGFTTICVDVVKDGPSQEVLSTNNCYSFYLQKFQPPMAQLPMCETQLDPELGFYTFQWSPPIGFTNTIDNDISYEFELYEWVDQSNYSIFQTGQGLVYTEITNQPLVQVSEYDVFFQEGMHYVWRVTATVSNLGMPVNMIEQGGVSAPCSFQFGEAQTLEETLADGLELSLSAQSLSTRKGRANWTVTDNTPGEGLSSYSSYIIEYRKKPQGNEGYEFSWFQDTVPNLTKDLYQLEPETTYECKVYGRVGSFTSEPTDIVEFTTPPPREYACGDQDLPYRSPNYSPLDFAEAGMKVEIGQFVMELSQVNPSGSAGRYSGKGIIPIDFLMGAQAKVKFDDIYIDNQFIVREGKVEVMTDGVDSWLHEQYKQFIDPIYVDGVVEDIYVDTTSGTAWITIGGDSSAYEFDPPDYPIIINDDDGNQYTIYPNGTIERSSYFDISNDYLGDNLTAENVAIFEQAGNEKYGFDAKVHTQWHEQYEIIELSDSSKYFVSNKSLAINETDKVIAKVPSVHSNVTFQRQNGQEVSASPLGGPVPTNSSGGQGGGSSDSSMVSYNVEIPAFSSKGEHALYVYADNQRIGKLNIHVFDEKEIDVVVVPIANVNLDSTTLNTAINNIFNEANIQVNLSTAPQWNNADFTATTTIDLPSDVTNFNKYSDHMRNLRDTYFDSVPNADKSKYYIFVVEGFTGSANEEGYMVRGKGLGFVTKNATPQTYAHELGHGAGALAHTWKNNGPEEGTTDNLMDYSGGSNLTLGQWEELRSLNLIPSFWDGEEDAMYSIFGWDNLFTFYRDNMSKQKLSVDAFDKAYLLPNNKPIHFSQPSEIQAVFFDKFGRMVAFHTNEDKYLAYCTRKATHETYTFKGFVKQTDKSQITNIDSDEFTPQQQTLIDQLKYKKFASTNSGDECFSIAQIFTLSNNTLHPMDCLSELSWNHSGDRVSASTDVIQPLGLSVRKEALLFSENISIISSNSIEGEECDLDIEFLSSQNELGFDVYTALYSSAMSSDEVDSLKYLCNKLSEITENKENWAFYVPDLYTSGFGKGFDFVEEYFQTNQLNSWTAFRSKFKHNSDQTHDCDVIFTATDNPLWHNISNTYNQNSIDYIKKGSGCDNCPYEYSYKDLFTRHYLSSSQDPLMSSIQIKENKGEAEPINLYSVSMHTWMINKYGSVSSMAFLGDLSANIMMDLLPGYFGNKLLAKFGPQLQSLLSNSLRNAKSFSSREATKRAIIGASTDIAIQLGFNHYFMDMSWEDALDEMDYSSVFASALNNVITYNNPVKDALINSGAYCSAEFTFSGDNFTGEDCIKNMLAAIAMNKISNNVFQRLQTLPYHKVSEGFQHLCGWTSQQVDDFLNFMGISKASLPTSNLSHFLDDAFVVSKRVEVTSSNLPTQFPSLTIDELTAIKVYTSDEFRNGVKVYSELNNQLRSGNLDDYYLGLNQLLNDGLEKITPYQGQKVYRGCGIMESNIAHNWFKNQEIKFLDFKSSSSTMGKASNFMSGDIYYEILNPKGINVCDISCQPTEMEVLFRPNAKFKVIEIKSDAVIYNDAFEPIEAKKITLEFLGYE